MSHAKYLKLELHLYSHYHHYWKMIENEFCIIFKLPLIYTVYNTVMHPLYCQIDNITLHLRLPSLHLIFNIKNNYHYHNKKIKHIIIIILIFINKNKITLSLELPLFIDLSLLSLRFETYFVACYYYHTHS